MLEHQISEACLDTRVAEPIGEHTIESGQRVVSWKGSIAYGVAQSYGCFMYWKRAAVTIVGRESDVAAVRYTYQYLVRVVGRLADEAWKATQTYESVRRWKHAFRVGAAQTIKQRLIGARRENLSQQRSQAKTPEATEALVRVANADEAVAVYYQELSQDFTNVRTSASSHWGYSAGIQAGQSVQLGGGAALKAPALRLTGKVE